VNGWKERHCRGWVGPTASVITAWRTREYSGLHIHAAPPPGGYEMMERIAEASPRPKARITGIVYLLYFLTLVTRREALSL